MVLKGRAQGQAQQMEAKSLIHPLDKYLSSASRMPGTVGSRGEPARGSKAEGVGGAGTAGHGGGVAPAVGVAPRGPCREETRNPVCSGPETRLHFQMNFSGIFKY